MFVMELAVDYSVLDDPSRGIVTKLDWDIIEPEKDGTNQESD